MLLIFQHIFDERQRRVTASLIPRRIFVEPAEESFGQVRISHGHAHRSYQSRLVDLSVVARFGLPPLLKETVCIAFPE